MSSFVPDGGFQTLTFNSVEPSVMFAQGTGPVLGMGEGGPQFDRRGTTYTARNGAFVVGSDDPKVIVGEYSRRRPLTFIGQPIAIIL